MTQVLSGRPTEKPVPAPTADSAARLGGTIHINEDVIAKMASHAASELPDVGCPTRGLGHMGADTLGTKADLRRRPKASAQIDGDNAYVDLVVSVRWPALLPQVTSALREHVRTRIEDLAGLHVHTVNIYVADLVDDTHAGARVH
ncbi:Asp23/Gls24 family envelope stress response protein [Catellatospora vulcania]|uniref:Asp23/Gls24 family envelope stress response protein n=1 Tax=Catellatospora vulcania TaxID=1460450 RepID=UPI0012D4784A|nr:Asp23/Gls24 family envelope stress response protein [Catellatospora vulcania]